jgi:hypothetical protein
VWKTETKSGDAVKGTTLVIVIAGGKEKLYCPESSRQCPFVLLVNVGSKGD